MYITFIIMPKLLMALVNYLRNFIQIPGTHVLPVLSHRSLSICRSCKGDFRLEKMFGVEKMSSLVRDRLTVPLGLPSGPYMMLMS